MGNPMSEQEQMSAGSGGGSSAVSVEQVGPIVGQAQVSGARVVVGGGGGSQQADAILK